MFTSHPNTEMYPQLGHIDSHRFSISRLDIFEL
jgi:hypothetical protein